MDEANVITMNIEIDEERFADIVRKVVDEHFSFGEPVDDEYDPHTVAEAMCWKCGARWIAAFPSATLLKELQCPGCHNSGHAFLTGQDIVEDD